MNKQNCFLDDSTEKKIEELLGKMTVKEKIGQLNQIGSSPVGAFEISQKEMQELFEAGRITEQEYKEWKSENKWDANEEKNQNRGNRFLYGTSE